MRPAGNPKMQGVVLGVTLLVAAIASLIGGRASVVVSGSDSQAIEADRVVLYTMPGVVWSEVVEADTPTIDRLVEEGATAAMAPRTASVRPSPLRGYLTLGAGNRAMSASDHESADDVVLTTDEPEALRARVGDHRDGDVAHLAVPELAARQTSEYHGSVVGALGEALAAQGLETGVVSAAEQDMATIAGGPVLAIADADGVVTHGSVRGLVVADESKPFGVTTSAAKFASAVEQILEKADVVLVDPGETARADAFAVLASEEVAESHRRRALEAADDLLASVVELLEPEDLLLVLAPSSPVPLRSEHLVPAIAWGADVDPGFLVSSTTRRPGIVTLTDVAPTVISALGAERPDEMSGRAMRSVPDTDAQRIQIHDDLDSASVFREKFVPSVFYSFIALFVVLSLLVGLVFLGRLPLRGPLAFVCYLILAFPLATFVLSLVPIWKLGSAPSHALLWLITIGLAAAALRMPGSAWAGAVPLLGALFIFITVDLLTGGELLVNAIFGNSVLAAGRFYGIPNTGSALYFGAGVLALGGAAELRGRDSRPVWFIAGLIAVVVLVGAPPFGSDVGGLIMGVAAVAVIFLVEEHDRIPWRVALLAVVAAGAITLGVAYLDSLRDTADQTHLGRFGASLFGGDASALQVVSRKASQAWASLGFSRFTYVVPLGIAALGVLLRRPTSASRTALSGYTNFRAALAGLMVAGILGFAVNDSGVAVPAMLLAQAVPLVVLLGLTSTPAEAPEK